MIDVAYLAYYNKEKEYDINVVKNFFIHYGTYNAGTEHKFTVIAKNWHNSPSEYNELKNLAKKYNAEIMELPDDGLDFGAYFRAAKILKENNVFFLGSGIQILKDNWLKIFDEAFKDDKNLKLAGPMGSYEQGLSNIYPNPHIRTCAFMVDRKLFSEYADSQPFPKKKEDTWILEHGPISITRFIQDKGYKAAVINAKSEIYDVKDCINSKTYFHPQQEENGLMGDKWFLKYKNGLRRERINTERVVWGKNLTPLLENFIEEPSELVNIIVPTWNYTNVLFSSIFRPIFYGEMGFQIDTKALVCPSKKETFKHRLETFKELDCYDWILKNYLQVTKAEYIGFNQKENFLDINFEIPENIHLQQISGSDFDIKLKSQNDKGIFNKLSEYDIIVAKKLALKGCNLSQQYQLVFNNEINYAINQIILKITPEYAEALEETLKATEIYIPGNFIMKKDLLKDYLNWQMKIIQKLDEMHIYSKYKDTVGSVFQTERFFNVWLNAHKDLKIKETGSFKILYT